MPSRLSFLDASFLQLEASSANAHMHIGGVLIFAGRAPGYDDFCAVIARRIHLVPRYRQRLQFVPSGIANPQWVDDPHFRLERHVHAAALPIPGTEAQLVDLVSRIFSERLHRDRPLWELWLVEGLDKDRFGLVSKMHHCLSDGISGVDIATLILDLDQTPPDATDPPQAWRARPLPSATETLGAAVAENVRRSMKAVRTATSLARQPHEWAPTMRTARSAAVQLGRAIRGQAPPSPYNVHIGAGRRFTWVHASLSDVKAINTALGGTLNDVVLAAVAGAMHGNLHRLGSRAGRLDLMAMVPVNLRTEAERRTLGNRLALMYVPLPVRDRDAISRLRRVRKTMRSFKEGDQVAGIELLSSIGNLLPPRLVSGLARLAGSARVFNVTVTNIPGPQFPLYLLGRELRRLVPMVPVTDKHAVGIAAMSYNGWVSFGLLGDDVVMEDIEELAGDLCRALTELAEAAGTAMPSLELPPARVEAPRQVAGRKTDVIPMPLGSGSPRGLSGRGAGRAR